MSPALAAPVPVAVWFAQALQPRIAVGLAARVSPTSAGVSAGQPTVAGWTESSFCDFHERTARALAAYVQQSTRNATITEDIVQESFLRFLRADRAPETEQHARNYLYRIATNIMRDRHRRRDLEVPLAYDPDRQPSTDKTQYQVVVQSDLQRLLTELPARDRQMLWLAHVEELSHREVALVMGLREISVRPMLFRARKRFARRLAEVGFDQGSAVSTATGSIA